jgi:hypothetical protein
VVAHPVDGGVDGAHQRDDLRLGVLVWAEALRNPRIHDLVRRGVDGPRALVRERVRADLDPDALIRVLIAIYQGLMLQTVWDDTLDHDAFVGTVEALVAASAVDPQVAVGQREQPGHGTGGRADGEHGSG